MKIYKVHIVTQSIDTYTHKNLQSAKIMKQIRVAETWFIRTSSWRAPDFLSKVSKQVKSFTKRH